MPCPTFPSHATALIALRSVTRSQMGVPALESSADVPPQNLIRHRSLTDACADTLACMARAHSTRFTTSLWFTKLVQTMFDTLDTDGDGTLSQLETTVGIYTLYGAINRKLRARIQTPSREAIDKLFESVDADKNRQLDAGEFYNLCVVVTSSVTRDLLRAFLRDIVVLPLAIYATKKLLVRLRGSSPLLAAASALFSRVPAVVLVPLTRSSLVGVLASITVL
ncbi:hypothetical protein PPROV_000740100 [Pycnococcus provasolii]|uniref:EF-hand domain-containing protein n=1 Tax=Pycnococcus provasolii TaxID=41880 RepID=A0A830HNB8_9CHLO|nr:hypothetical protein PPROV_000740100 [Pycnococcus provasolii]